MASPQKTRSSDITALWTEEICNILSQHEENKWALSVHSSRNTSKHPNWKRVSRGNGRPITLITTAANTCGYLHASVMLWLCFSEMLCTGSLIRSSVLLFISCHFNTHSYKCNNICDHIMGSTCRSPVKVLGFLKDHFTHFSFYFWSKFSESLSNQLMLTGHFNKYTFLHVGPLGDLKAKEESLKEQSTGSCP